MESIAAALSPAQARSALSWWIEAGVDVAIQEEPRNWSKPRARKAEPKVPAPPEPNVSAPSHETLAELQQWLASSMQLPFAGRSGKRIMPHGPVEAPVMVLSDLPQAADAAEGRPIGGESWVLAQRMLGAIGIAPDQAYCASLSCIHAPGSRLSEEERRACADLARQQIRLARPKRLLLFGNEPCLALLGKSLAHARGHVHQVEGVRTVATFHPRSLLQQSSNKSLAWRDLLLLMEDES